MFTYNVYKKLKQEISIIGPVFYFLNQYGRNKDKTSYNVPAIYIEMPKQSKVDSLNRKIKVLLKQQIKLHYISYAPFKSDTDNIVQDNALAQHSATLLAINTLIDNLQLKDGDTSLTNQFILVNTSELVFEDMCVYSILTYQTDIYLRR
ncbi:MAG: hypothetical protein JST94_11860 [Bacteroidetes bacterium]|nr:hypothetical protein [Bacteroidota bacterium]